MNSGLIFMLKSMGINPDDVITMVTELSEVVKVAAADLQTIKQQNVEILALLNAQQEKKEVENVD